MVGIELTLINRVVGQRDFARSLIKSPRRRFGEPLFLAGMGGFYPPLI